MQDLDTFLTALYYCLSKYFSQPANNFSLYQVTGAPHGFFDRGAEQFAEASCDAWQRVLDFISTHTH